MFRVRNLGFEWKTGNGFVGFVWKRDAFGLNRVREMQSLRKSIEYDFLVEVLVNCRSRVYRILGIGRGAGS